MGWGGPGAVPCSICAKLGCISSWNRQQEQLLDISCLGTELWHDSPSGPTS